MKRWPDSVTQKCDIVEPLLRALYSGEELLDNEGFILSYFDGRVWIGGAHEKLSSWRMSAKELAAKLITNPRKFRIFRRSPVESEQACQKCGAHEMIPVVYGLIEAYHGDDELDKEHAELLHKEDRGEVWLGGCIPEETEDGRMITHICRICLERARID
jgi:hypothetical protein